MCNCKPSQRCVPKMYNWSPVPLSQAKSTGRHRETAWDMRCSGFHWNHWGNRSSSLGTFLQWPDGNKWDKRKQKEREESNSTKQEWQHVSCFAKSKCAWIWYVCRSWLRKTEDFKFCMLSFLRIGHVVGRWKGDVYNEQKIPLARASRMCWFPDMILSVLSTLPQLLPSVNMLWSHPSRMQQPPSSSQATGETKWSSEARARG